MRRDSTQGIQDKYGKADKGGQDKQIACQRLRGLGRE